jgi:hypothetical protein
MKRAKQVFKAFMPMFILIFGGLIMVGAGVNNVPHVTSIFPAMLGMKWFGWIGVALQIYAMLILAGVIKVNWLK